MNNQDMPVLRPLPIKTNGKSTFNRIWAWVTEVRSWEVMENWQYTINEETIVIPKGFVFDGASIPRPLWGILSPTGLLLVPGLIHDFGYRYDYLWAIDHDATDHNAGAGKSYKKIHDKAGQAHWDQIFYSVGTEVNGMTTLNFLAWLALATMGRFSWDKHRNKNYGDVVPE